MGDPNVSADLDQRRRRAFTRAVLEDLEGLERLIDAGRIESGVRRIGAEQEMFLVDRSRQPAPIAVELLDRLGPEPRVTTELARFNLEANASPRDFGGRCLRDMEDEICDLIARVDGAARELDASVTLAGILPTLRTRHLTLDNMTPNPRYSELNRAITAARDGAFSIVIKGLDELDITHDNVMLEAANTSFQIHFQVGPDEFAPLYNLAQVISAPVLAAAVNSPLLLGQRLWHETRVALFQRSVDSRSSTHKRRSKPARVSFGDDWIDASILEIYKEDIARFRIMLSSDDVDERAVEVVTQGGVPHLRALRMHTGTVWRWNRACYGIGDEGTPHLRIENRVLPSGPTVIDEMANAAFFFGLMSSLANDGTEIREVMDFDDAKANFYSAARHGLGAQFAWMGGRQVTAHELIVERLLPRAREGLAGSRIDADDIERYLGVIERRVRTGQTGATWALRSLSKMSKAPTDVRMRSITWALLLNQRSAAPVHEWPLAKLYQTRDWLPSYRTVDQFMSTDLYTVRPDDPVGLAANIMDWRRIRHVPVEDDHGKLVGMISFRDLIPLLAKRSVGEEAAEGETMCRDVMKKDPLSAAADAPTLDVLHVMRDENIGSLPVVDEDGRLLGLVTVYDLLDIAGKVIEDFLRDDDTHAAGAPTPPPPRPSSSSSTARDGGEP
ncbi:MAG: CBS domain-containing protein [Myxococcota bacterium]